MTKWCKYIKFKTFAVIKLEESSSSGVWVQSIPSLRSSYMLKECECECECVKPMTFIRLQLCVEQDLGILCGRVSVGEVGTGMSLRSCNSIFGHSSAGVGVGQVIRNKENT